MYPASFDGLSRETLLQYFETIYAANHLTTHLSLSQQKSLLANLANLRALLDEKIQDLDVAIDILSAV
jgi:hypothetical protein